MSSRPVDSCGPILCFSDEKFSVRQVSGRAWLTLQELPWGLTCCHHLSVDVLWNLVYLWEDVVYVGPGWTLKGSSCVWDEEGVEFIWI